MDGVYETNINTPMGNINARIALKQTENIANAMLELMGTKNALAPGRVQGNKCYFTGELKSNMMSLRYNIITELVDNVLNIYAKTNMGEFNLKANKIA